MEALRRDGMLENVKHIHYISDGAASQYKNNKISAICTTILKTTASRRSFTLLRPHMASTSVTAPAVFAKEQRGFTA